MQPIWHHQRLQILLGISLESGADAGLTLTRLVSGMEHLGRDRGGADVRGCLAQCRAPFFCTRNGRNIRA